MSLTTIAEFLSSKKMSNAATFDSKMYLDQESRKDPLLEGGDLRSDSSQVPPHNPDN